MNEVSAGIVRWLEHKRRTERVSAAALSVLTLGSGGILFAFTALLVYILLRLLCGAVAAFHSASSPWLGLAAFGVTAGLYARIMKARRHPVDLELDVMGFWILKDVSSIGPRLLLEGFRELRRCGDLGEMNVTACARALAYLAAQDRAVNWDELLRHCPQMPSERLREQLSLLDGVLFLGEDAARVTLMEPFRLRLRWLLGPEWERERERREARAQGAANAGSTHGARGPKAKARPRPAPQAEPAPQPVPALQPEKLSPYELLGVSPSASALEIKAAYRKRIKECHPDLFASMDPPAKALAERWAKALNAAYATLNPRNQHDVRPSTARQA